QYAVTRLREPLAHLAKRRAKPERVRPDEHGGVGAFGRMDEVGIGYAVRRLDLHVALDDGLRVDDGRQHHRDARSRGQGTESPAGQTVGIALEVFQKVLVTHGSCSPLDLRSRRSSVFLVGRLTIPETSWTRACGSP